MKMVGKQFVFLAGFLLASVTSRGQLVTIGIDGFNRFGHLKNEVGIQGPLAVIDHTHYYDYGIWASYERGQNGLRVGVHSFSYGTDLTLKGSVLNVSGSNSTLGLYSLAYQRNILKLVRGRLNLYAVAGVGFGRYHYTRTTTTPGYVQVNGVNIFETQTRLFSEYTHATVLIPSLRLEAAYAFGKHFRVAAWSEYDCANYLGALKPLAAATYSYTTGSGTGSGTLLANGSGFSTGASLRYTFRVGYRDMAY